MYSNSLMEITDILNNDPTFSDVVNSAYSKNKPTIIAPRQVYGYLIISLVKYINKPTIVVTSNPEESRNLIEDLNFWSTRTIHMNFNERNEIFLEKYKPNKINTIERLRCLNALYMKNYYGKTPIIATSIQSLSTKTIPFDLFTELSFNLEIGMKKKLEEAVNNLINNGYKKTSLVENPGEFAVRGDILDIFSLSNKNPIRVDFFYDVIENIRLFNPNDQQSYDELKKIEITPIEETLVINRNFEKIKSRNKNCLENNETYLNLNEELKEIIETNNDDSKNLYSGFFDYGSIFDYLKKDYLIINLDQNKIFSELNTITKYRGDSYDIKVEKKEIPKSFPVPYISINEMEKIYHSFSNCINIAQIDRGETNKKSKFNFSLPTVYSSSKNILSKYIDKNVPNQKIIITTDYPKRVKEILNMDDLNIFDGIEISLKSKLSLISKNLGEGFSLKTKDNMSILILTDKEIFGIRKKHRYNSLSNIPQSTKSLDLFEKNDFVVHIDHGIGRYNGTIILDETGREFIEIFYKNDDKLYVPADQIDRIQPYKSYRKDNPQLDSLGSTKWIKTKNKAKQSIEILAAELLKIYAAREKIKGNKYSEDSDWQKILEESFEFKETKDQLSAIEEIKNDLESKNPMDRLLCGDVGYGKTEVAIRAAFKSVENGYQVAILVPTTVLALQHFHTFKERLNPFPINIQYLSRFVTDKNVTKIKKELSKGQVDIIIGTHKLIQNDIKFNNLGLLIIDEEHKFGVNQKEYIKHKQINVDVLSLSATPIPRTLNMALNGIRDLSMISSPPENRLPVNTYVSEYSDKLIREALIREIDRKGQIFFIHNEIFNIEIITQKIKKLVPEAIINFAHGQMEKNHLENVINDFIDKKFNVLICTTIIESGIDMPNVNTLIVNNSHKFGLSQLYQIRGRIGRSEKSSFAYFMVPKNSILNKNSEDRLSALISSSEYGTGYNLALRDLELRGAGNVLGKEQSGHINNIGYDLYNSLLKSAVDTLKKGNDLDLGFFLQNIIDIKINARIPDSYIGDLSLKLQIYLQIAKIRTLEELKKFVEEIVDRFGKIPIELQNLIQITKLKIISYINTIISIKGNEEKVIITFDYSLSDMKGYINKKVKGNFSIGFKQIIFIPENKKEFLLEIEIFLGELSLLRVEMIEKFRKLSKPI